MIKKVIKQILLLPNIRKRLYKFCDFILGFYHYSLYKQYFKNNSYKETIKAHKKVDEILKELDKFDIKENFTADDASVLLSLVNMIKKDGIIIVEVGSWKGFSTSFLARSVIDYNGKVFTVDHFQGTPGVWNYEMAKKEDIYQIFKKNMVLLGLWDRVYPLIMNSQTAAEIFANEIVDMCFLDGDHRYTYFKNDILAWFPKIKVGGILCGHDCEGYYDNCSYEVSKIIDKNLDKDYISSLCHPGIVKALYEVFGKDYSKAPNSTVWWHIKKKSDLLK